MELLIQADQFVITYSPAWMLMLLFMGLLLFFISKSWRTHLHQLRKHSFMPSVLFTVSFIFLIGGINLYVYKIVMNKDKIILFNVKQFNQQIKWTEIERVDYQDEHKIVIFMNHTAPQSKPVQIDLADLDDNSMDKVKILINLKLKQSKNSAMELNRTH
ncbi:MAG: hypothetical protein KZQ64_10200 [gamma proteobacterium symbiont of Bathyaustriella thionipta]|nr:hypothetical protein [gamma proteobacterium symbiont of Bathyaustriella thionipta]MCU7950650.1 hypothetical protein [gamma proteobacterium symbiont of Bathyaustriella thionipta]MCU7953742.1 hypothetical protein [gamma proteobacterium symbiont of Bathyaustriella thionipta]MCU7957141.1 hypothetical protein [gamma proteobacterium symbiont of Bathyaustriella thionipta]MCU7968438.1 hypothetical protein [gamma proteobacterium symbiont of Bathyaustriella thionipta]